MIFSSLVKYHPAVRHYILVVAARFVALGNPDTRVFKQILGQLLPSISHRNYYGTLLLLLLLLL